MDTPRIKLEVEHMRHTIVKALCEYESNLNEQIKQAVEKYCSTENLANVIEQEVSTVIDGAVKEEITRYFSWGQGRDIIKEVVIKRLTNHKE